MSAVNEIISSRFGIYSLVLEKNLTFQDVPGDLLDYLGVERSAACIEISELFPEVVGLEPDIMEIISGLLEKFLLGYVNRIPEREIFFNLHVYPCEINKNAIVFIEDVTESGMSLRHVQQRRNELFLANMELLHRDEFINTLLNTMTNPVFYKDEKGRYLGCNTAFAAFIGMDQHEIIGKTDHDLMFPGIVSLHREDDKDLLISGGERHYESVVKNCRGEERYVIVSRAAFPAVGGSTGGIVGVMADITERKEMEDRLAKSEESLRDRNAVMENDLRLARKTLSALIDETPPAIPGCSIAVRYQPLEEVGGDYFSIVPLGEMGAAVFLCDITGHGVTAALFLSLIKYFSERIFFTCSNDPGGYLFRMNNELHGYIASYFITGLYGVLDLGTMKKFRFSAGAHPLPVILRKNGKAEFAGESGIVIGFVANAMYPENEVRIFSGDMVFLYTDGIPETRNKQDRIVGFEEELLSLFERGRRSTIEDTLDAVMKSLGEYRGDVPYDDDIVLLGFEIH